MCLISQKHQEKFGNYTIERIIILWYNFHIFMKVGVIMKKFTKIISVILAVVLVIMAVPFTSFAATKGDVDGNGEISAVDARLILQVVAGLKKEADLKNAAGADVDGKSGITAVDARIVLQIVAGLVDAPTEPEKPSGELTKADYAALFNAESAKAAKGAYNWTRECKFTKDIDVGNASETLNRIIKMIDANADLNSVVGGFLGVGNATGTQKDAGKYALIAMNLKESDIKDIQLSAGQITLLLNNSHNPSKGGDTPFNHVSNDFVTEDEVKKSIAEVTTAITVNSCSFNYCDVAITADVDKDGKPISLRISYKMSATMGLKAAVANVNGSGEVETKIKYTDLKY